MRGFERPAPGKEKKGKDEGAALLLKVVSLDLLSFLVAREAVIIGD